MSFDKDTYRTPRYVFNWLEQRFAYFHLDGCATAQNTLCHRWIGKGSEIMEDFLADDFVECLLDEVAEQCGMLRIFVNPPYSNPMPFVKRAAELSKAGHLVVMLLPADKSTKWYQVIQENANDEGVCFPSYQYIADHCEITKRSAITHIEKLIKMGLVSKKARKNKDGSSSNLYYLHLDTASENISPPPVKEFHHPSENISPPPSEMVSPITNHSINQSINHTPLTPQGVVGVGEQNSSDGKFNPETVELPDYVDRTRWIAYCRMRKAKTDSAIKTPETAEYCLKRLAKLSGGNPIKASEVLEQSTANTWTGLFELKQTSGAVNAHDTSGAWAVGRRITIKAGVGR